jgi:hypothetical protein
MHRKAAKSAKSAKSAKTREAERGFNTEDTEGENLTPNPLPSAEGRGRRRVAND